LCETRGDRQARNPARAAETEHRHAGYVGSETHAAEGARLEARRRNSGGTDRYNGVDVAGGEVRASQRFAGGVDEERLGAFEKSLGAFRPAAPFKIPVERFHAVTFYDSSVGKNA
jgi:hypothetical protein